MPEAVVAEVRLSGKFVGAVSEEETGTITFEYDPTFARSGLEISPIRLPLSTKGPITFPELHRREAFGGLPGVLADALPDRFGNAVIARYFADRGRPEASLSPVQKLLYIGARAMGALEFAPAERLPRRKNEQEPLEIATLVAAARSVIEGSPQEAIPEILRVGASAAGARPKALILWNQGKDEIRSGFAKPKEGDEYWIIKFDGVGEPGKPDRTARPYNRIEYAYSKMAAVAGIDLPETRLIEEGQLGHFLTKRFDRHGPVRIHRHSLGGMQHVDFNAPGAFSYEAFIRTVLQLELGHTAIEQGFRRAAFNLAAVNQDDHVKNIEFLMDERGQWRLAPAFDLTHARGQGFTKRHQMTLGGKQDGFLREDLLKFGEFAGLRNDGKEILNEVSESLHIWPMVAKEAGISAETIREIQNEFRRF